MKAVSRPNPDVTSGMSIWLPARTENGTPSTEVHAFNPKGGIPSCGRGLRRNMSDSADGMVRCAECVSKEDPKDPGKKA